MIKADTSPADIVSCRMMDVEQHTGVHVVNIIYKIRLLYINGMSLIIGSQLICIY